MTAQPRLLVACEFSGIVRDAFLARGWDAWSCDLIPTERPGPHIVNDVRNVLGDGWDMMIAHPPCTDLANSGRRWFPFKQQKQREALDFVRVLLAAPIPMIALENPIGVIPDYIRPYDQLIQPWQFGEPVSKATCLWLINLPPLMYSLICTVREPKCWLEPDGPEQARNRSRTLPGIASAMAAQWSMAAVS